MSKSVQALRVVLFVAVLAVAGGAHAATDTFIQFVSDGASTARIVGEAKSTINVTGYESTGWSEIKSITFGIENTLNISSATTGAGAGKATFNEIAIETTPGNLSTLLFTTCGMGGHYTKACIAFRKAGAASGVESAPFLTLELAMVAVKSVNFTNSSGDDTPSVRIVLNCGQIKMSYYKQDAAGKLETKPVVSMWNMLKNTNTFVP